VSAGLVAAQDLLAAAHTTDINTGIQTMIILFSISIFIFGALFRTSLQ
jgi:hypothetical protein